ncbi:hypothetical protein [Mesorhizobium sp. M1340]|uniref:hypothetical protein n=1 Tax=unclassified Mesorhizobium TaxID=325217 RepID=UPI003336E144
MICCKAFQVASTDSFDNLTIRKIPGAILDSCEWGKDDYSLKIESLPSIDEDLEVDEAPRRRPGSVSNQPTLFDRDEEEA